MIKENYLERVKLNYTIKKGDELASAIVHMVGFGLNLTGMILLIVYSAIYGNSLQVTAFCLFGALHNLYYIFSVLFHSLPGENTRKVFRIFELSSSYLLMIGIVIPLTLIAQGGNIGWFFFSIFTALGILGITVVSINPIKCDIWKFVINSLLFILSAIFILYSYNEIPGGLKLWLAIAAVSYFSGLLIRYFAGLPFRHALSHFFYITGSVSLFFGFFFFLI